MMATWVDVTTNRPTRSLDVQCMAWHPYPSQLSPYIIVTTLNQAPISCHPWTRGGGCEGLVMLQHFETRMANGAWRNQVLYVSSLLNVASIYCTTRKEHPSDHGAPWQDGLIWLARESIWDVSCFGSINLLWVAMRFEKQSHTMPSRSLGRQNRLGSTNNPRFFAHAYW